MILVDEQNTSADTKQEVALTVAHEVAHQWFGNLVTMEWWTDLWLNEGFATWAEYFAVDSMHPEFQIWNSYLNSGLMPALALDRLVSSHPVEVEVMHPGQIDEIFDAISYSKGCAVIRMLVSFMGIDAFKTGLVKYLQKYLYRNARTKDLWAELESSSGLPICEMMQGWTKEVGYPLITVKPAQSNNINNTLTMNLSQRRFLMVSGAPSSTSSTSGDVAVSTPSKWVVPITVALPDGTRTTHLLRDSSADVSVPLSEGGADFCLLNPDRTSFFAVHYPSEWIPKIAVC